MNTPETEMIENVQGMDKCEKRAWLILLVVFALFMIGLIMVCSGVDPSRPTATGSRKSLPPSRIDVWNHPGHFRSEEA